MRGNTVIDVPFEVGRPLGSLPEPDAELSDLEGGVSHRLFRIRTADTAGHRSSASLLIDRMYATRGYTTCGLPGGAGTPEQITLVASDDAETIGGAVDAGGELRLQLHAGQRREQPRQLRHRQLVGADLEVEHRARLVVADRAVD